MELNNRILIVDDNKNIHDDFMRVLSPSKTNRLNEAILDLESSLFGDTQSANVEQTTYRIDSSYSGEDALVRIIRAQKEGDPYALVFTDVRMAPGLDGVQLVGEIWKHAPYTEVVIVTAFSDYSWEEMVDKIGVSDRLLFLRKPFDTVTIKQIATTFTKKWSLDMLARKQLESLQMNRVVIDEMRDAVFWFGSDGRFFSVNETATKGLEYTREELLELHLFDISPDYGRDTFGQCWLELKQRRSMLVESSFIAKSGRQFPVEIAFSYMEHENKAFGCLVVRDITERKQSEERLRKLEERWRFLWENVPDNIIELDLDARVKICNRTVGGNPVEELIGSSLFDLIPDDQHETLRAVISKVLETGESGFYESPLVTLDGETWWSNRVAPIKRDGEISGLLLIGSDITVRRRTGEALRKSEMRLEEAQRIAQIGNWEWDFSTGDIFWSEEMFRIFGYDQDEGAPTLDLFFERTHPDDREILNSAIDTTISKGRPLKVEYRVIMPNDSVRYIYANAKVELDKKRQPLRLIGTAQNISDRRKVEQERASLESQLQHVQKMETLGTLAGGIAHDFNNILTPILGYTEMAMENAGESRIREDLQQALKAANRAKELVSQILIFSRHVEHEHRPIDLGLIIKEAVKMLRAWVPTTIDITVDLDSDNALVLADATQLHQVIMNLCTNAYHALRDTTDGSIRISLKKVAIDESLARLYPKLELDEYLQLTIRDTGHGMDEATMSRIFEPFFTTKGVGDGTGLGLSVVHGIVTGHKGAVTVESEVGSGTAFHIYLPFQEGDQETIEEEKVGSDHGAEHILFVDDETIIAEMGREMLSRMGYEITIFSESLLALEAFKEHPDRYDLVITDQTMPKMTGVQLAQEILAIRPQIPIILISGFSETVTAEDSKKMGIREYVSKPILAHDLNRAIRRVLDQDA